jgi:hypothetical protein
MLNAVTAMSQDARSRLGKMEGEVESMEQRLQMLKGLMAGEKAKREAKRLPGGASWRSARQDGSGVGAKYVDRVLEQQQGRGAPKSHVASTASSAGRVGRLRAETVIANAVASAIPPPSPPGGSPVGAAPRPGRHSSSPRALPIAPLTVLDTPSAAAGETRDLSELLAWLPAASIANDGDDENVWAFDACVREERAGHAQRSPVHGEQSAHHLAQRICSSPRLCPRAPSRFCARSASLQDLLTAATETRSQRPSGSIPQQAPRSLLSSTFDEDESAQSFQDALRAWRGEPPPGSAPPPRSQPPRRETADEIFARAQNASQSVGAKDAWLGSARRASRGSLGTQSTAAAAVSTQAGAKLMSQMSLYERFQEQKRRDGLLP